MTGGLRNLWHYILLLGRIRFGSDKLISLSVDIYNLYRGILAKMFAKLGDVHIHGAGVEIIVVNPDGLEGKVALKYFIDVRAQQ